MSNIWGKILKQKKIVSFGLLFFIVVGIILPSVALGWSNSIEAECKFANFCIEYGTTYLMLGIGDFVTYLGEGFTSMCGSFFNIVFGKLIKDPNGDFAITRDKNINGVDTVAGSVFLTAWNAVKQWANMLIILGLIGVALAFILNLDQYKKLLAPLLIVALLVNFSVVFVGLIIDASNILMKSLLVSGEEGTNIIYRINELWNSTLWKYPITTFDDSVNYLALSFLFLIIWVAVGLTLFMLAVIFVERFVMLAILFILSPLAFVFRVFPLPAAKKLWDSWWNSFIKWCFVGIIGGFFMYLGTEVIVKFVNSGVFKVDIAQNANTITILLGQMGFYFGLVILFLLIGVYFTFKASGWMSGIVIAGAIATGTALAAGGAALTGKTLKPLKPSGVFRDDDIKQAKAGLSYYGTKIGERFGLAKKGTAEQRWQETMQERLKEPTERLKNIKDNKELGQIAGTGRSPIERAAATNILKERDSLGDIPMAYRERAMRNAMAHDNRLKGRDFAKSHFEFAKFDNKKVEEVMKRRRLNKTDAEDFVVREQLVQNLPTMSDFERASIDKTYLDNDFVIENFNPSIARSFKIAKKSVRARIRNTRSEIQNRIRAVKKGGPQEDPAEYNRLRNLLKTINKIPA